MSKNIKILWFSIFQFYKIYSKSNLSISVTEFEKLFVIGAHILKFSTKETV